MHSPQNTIESTGRAGCPAAAASRSTEDISALDAAFSDKPQDAAEVASLGAAGPAVRPPSPPCFSPGSLDACVRMQVVHCWGCGLVFAIPATMYFDRLSTRRRVCCPGCSCATKLPDPLEAGQHLARYNAALVGELETLRLRLERSERA